MGVSEEVASAFSQSSIRMTREGTPLSHDSTLRNTLAHPTAAAIAEARARLDSEAAHNPLAVVVELRDAHGARIAAAGDTTLPMPPAGNRTSAIGPLIARHDTVLTDSRLPVLGTKADTLGFVRELSRASSSTSSELLSGLIGGNARLLVGNASGDLWTDLDKRVEGPRGARANGRPDVVTMPDGTQWIGGQTAIAATSWVVWVGRSESDILAGAHDFLRRMLLVAILVIVLGGVGARVLGRHIIAPLAGLTKAAEGIAAGDYSTRVSAVRHDEVGRLAIAFNGMAHAVQSASLELENQQTELEIQQVELEESNEQLRESIANLTRAREAEDQSKARAEGLEAQLVQSQKMEAIGRLAGGVAHDFNNILTVIISYADLVLADQTLSETARADVANVRKGADRASALTRQLLAFSRKQVLHPAVLNLSDSVGDVMTMLSRVMPANISVKTALEESVHPVCVDRGQLEQVLMNLAVNARDAMPSGGTLVIETSNATLDDAYVALHPGGTTGPHAVLSVRDSGMGMDAETRARIFEPFFTTKEVGRGTGLGLAMVYGIVRQSGGSIYVYSEPGLGTTFKVYFPAYSTAASTREDGNAVAEPTVEPLAILLVEDDAAVRVAAKLVLEQLGHTVVSAEHVAAALNIIRAGDQRFDIVLTDAVMPGRSGSDLADVLRQERPELPVIIMSGYAEDVVSHNETTDGVVFLEKPFTASSVTTALATALGRVSSPEPSEDWIA
jgi:signal transduction histidine kinase/CheY-like chemotaxis protein